MKIKYSYQGEKENIAKAHGRDIGISTKHAIEICNQLRGMPLKKAKQLLSKVIKKEEPIRMRRFYRDTAHKKGMAAGKYPINAAEAILRILKSVETNAQNKGLSTSNLVIEHIAANRASRPWRYGRQRRRKAKRSHVEIIVAEMKKEKKESTGKKK